MTTKRYTGSVYIAVVGPDFEPAECRDSIESMIRRPGDSGPNFIRATKGYEARQMHINNFIASTCDFVLMLDHDQVFPRDTLERLRDHQLPYVSGYYLRRRIAPAFSVWYKPQRSPYDWPMLPWMEDPERGKLHELGASGWGCVLIHRDVIMAVRAILKGEAEVLEDDMDVWPYDLKAVLEGREQIRPLRGLKDSVGSDIRFPFFARQAGYKLMGDPDVRVGHMLDFNLLPDVVSEQAAIAAENQRRANADVGKMRQGHKKYLGELGGAK